MSAIWLRLLSVLNRIILSFVNLSGIFQELRFKGTAYFQILRTASQAAQQVDAPRLRLLLQRVDLHRQHHLKQKSVAGGNQRPVISMLEKRPYAGRGIDLHMTSVITAEPLLSPQDLTVEIAAVKADLPLRIHLTGADGMRRLR